MGFRILTGVRINECDKPGSCLYDSTTGMAFGPVIKDEDEAQDFLEWLEQRMGVHICLRGEIMNEAWNLYQKEWLPARRARSCA